MSMKRAVLVICDGLRADMVTPALTPNLCRIAAGGTVFTHHCSVFPSTTRTTSASIATGCLPGRHGLEGNCVALDEGRGLTVMSVGPPDFRDRLRKATGKTLRVPTLAERLENHGGCIVYSNVSAGAAYFQDPDGHGYVYHRQGSFGPGLQKLPAGEGLSVSHDAAGDTAMTERFVNEVLGDRKPRLAVLWQCEPDHTEHARPLGSPDHKAVIAAADLNAGRVADVVKRTAGGDDVLLIIASDHGHETVESIVRLETLLVGAGLKDAEDSTEVAVASNGFSANIYVSDTARGRIDAICRFLKGLNEVERVFAGDSLAEVGQRADGTLAIAVTPRRSDAKNAFGWPGMSVAFDNPLATETVVGCGQHGGLGPYEQNPFLIVRGGGFKAGRVDAPSSAVDIAPTILAHLGLPFTGMDGKPLATA
ncbi:MAG: alkaline phosphatase family protein [Rhodospirillales bacterium]|nr:alkaline phosphatase family protein [Rhodospirillales bacterium]